MPIDAPGRWILATDAAKGSLEVLVDSFHQTVRLGMETRGETNGCPMPDRMPSRLEK